MANVKKTSKATTEKKELVANNFSSIMDSVKEITKSSNSVKSSIYKAEFFEGLSDKEKKARRRKLRRVRDAFIGEWLACQKDTEKVKGLQERWNAYATQVYNDLHYIFERNTVEDNQETCNKFVQAMAQEYK